MKKQTGPDSVHLKTDEDLQTFIDHYDASIIGATCYVLVFHVSRLTLRHMALDYLTVLYVTVH